MLSGFSDFFVFVLFYFVPNSIGLIGVLEAAGTREWTKIEKIYEDAYYPIEKSLKLKFDKKNTRNIIIVIKNQHSVHIVNLNFQLPNSQKYYSRFNESCVSIVFYRRASHIFTIKSDNCDDTISSREVGSFEAKLQPIIFF